MDSKTVVRLLPCAGITSLHHLAENYGPTNQPANRRRGSWNKQPESQSIRHLHALNTVWWKLRSKSPKRFHGMIQGIIAGIYMMAKTQIPVLPWNQAATGLQPFTSTNTAICSDERVIKMHRHVSSSDPTESLAYHSLTIPPSSI